MDQLFQKKLAFWIIVKNGSYLLWEALRSFKAISEIFKRTLPFTDNGVWLLQLSKRLKQVQSQSWKLYKMVVCVYVKTSWNLLTLARCSGFFIVNSKHILAYYHSREIHVQSYVRSALH